MEGVPLMPILTFLRGEKNRFNDEDGDDDGDDDDDQVGRLCHSQGVWELSCLLSAEPNSSFVSRPSCRKSRLQLDSLVEPESYPTRPSLFTTHPAISWKQQQQQPNFPSIKRITKWTTRAFAFLWKLDGRSFHRHPPTHPLDIEAPKADIKLDNKIEKAPPVSLIVIMTFDYWSVLLTILSVETRMGLADHLWMTIPLDWMRSISRPPVTWPPHPIYFARYINKRGGGGGCCATLHKQPQRREDKMETTPRETTTTTATSLDCHQKSKEGGGANALPSSLLAGYLFVIDGPLCM